MLEKESQVHILNLPVGQDTQSTAKDTVKLNGIKLEMGKRTSRWKWMVCILVELDKGRVTLPKRMIFWKSSKVIYDP